MLVEIEFGLAAQGIVDGPPVCSNGDGLGFVAISDLDVAVLGDGELALGIPPHVLDKSGEVLNDGDELLSLVPGPSELLKVTDVFGGLSRWQISKIDPHFVDVGMLAFAGDRPDFRFRCPSRLNRDWRLLFLLFLLFFDLRDERWVLVVDLASVADVVDVCNVAGVADRKDVRLWVGIDDGVEVERVVLSVLVEDSRVEFEISKKINLRPGDLWDGFFVVPDGDAAPGVAVLDGNDRRVWIDGHSSFVVFFQKNFEISWLQDVAHLKTSEILKVFTDESPIYNSPNSRHR